MLENLKISYEAGFADVVSFVETVAIIFVVFLAVVVLAVVVFAAFFVFLSVVFVVGVVVLVVVVVVLVVGVVVLAVGGFMGVFCLLVFETFDAALDLPRVFEEVPTSQRLVVDDVTV